MKLNFFYSLTLLAVLLFSTGCDHETATFDGPNLVDRFGEFQLLENLTLNRNTVDFSAGETVIFGARFNKRINFSLVITGRQSGAVRVIQGFDSELTPANATWSGGVTSLPFFRQEICDIALIIPEADSLTVTAEVTITGTKSYEGSLVTDFETDPLDNIFFGNFEFELTNNSGRRNDGKAAQGNWYYNFEGTDNVVPNFFVGLIDIKASITGQTYFPMPTTVPEDLYFNTFMLADGGPHGIAVIQFIFDSNNSGAFEDGQDTAIPFGDINLNWVGWRHIFKPMSEVGITQAQLSKIVAIRLLLISDKNTQPNPPLPVDYGVDFLTFTSGGPLKL